MRWGAASATINSLKTRADSTISDAAICSLKGEAALIITQAAQDHIILNKVWIRMQTILLNRGDGSELHLLQVWLSAA